MDIRYISDPYQDSSGKPFEHFVYKFEKMFTLYYRFFVVVFFSLLFGFDRFHLSLGLCKCASRFSTMGVIFSFSFECFLSLEDCMNCEKVFMLVNI